MKDINGKTLYVGKAISLKKKAGFLFYPADTP